MESLSYGDIMIPSRSDSDRPTSEIESSRVALRNGQKIRTTLAELVTGLEKLGVDGPRHFRNPNLDARGAWIDGGAQFDVFADSTGLLANVVIKRVKAGLYLSSKSDSKINKSTQSHLRTLQLEISSLHESSRRKNANVVDLIAWGYDYPSSDTSLALPVLIVEKALASLTNFLADTDRNVWGAIASKVKYQICMDIAEGVKCVHSSSLAHGDLKPSNILIFKHSDPKVPFVAKLSDFGLCIDVSSAGTKFASYRGTDGWLPPEVMHPAGYVTDRFDPFLLQKSDVFAFGLLVLSVFYTKGEIPRLGQPSSLEYSLAHFVQNQELEADCEPYRQFLVRFSRSVLALSPQSRPDCGFELFDPQKPGYIEWLLHRSAQAKPFICPSGRKDADLYRGFAYWSKLDVTVLRQLERQYDALKDRTTGVSYAPETLFGMAVRKSVLRGRGHLEAVVGLMRDAAELDYPPAQAIMYRLFEASESFGRGLVVSDQVRKWLFGGASTGSRLAALDLSVLAPVLAQKARKIFLERGGYNEELTPVALSGILQFAQLPSNVGLPNRPDVVVDQSGNRPLHIAATYGNLEVIRNLIGLGASVNIQNDAGETALYKACLAGRHEVVEILTNTSADASISVEPFGITCMHWLFNFEDDKMAATADLLISKGASTGLLTKNFNDGNVRRPIPCEHFPFYWPIGGPLHWAAHARSFSAVKILLDRGAGIDDLDDGDDLHAQTALSMAMYRADSEMVQYLLSSGASPTLSYGRGVTAMHMMAISNIVMNRLFQLPENLRWWVYHGSVSNHLSELYNCARTLSQAAGYMNIINFQTRFSGSSSNCLTPLLDAVMAGHAGVVLALLNAGASADCFEPFNGRYPLQTWVSVNPHDLAYQSLHRPVCEALVIATTNLGVRDSLGGTALHQIQNINRREDFEYLAGILTKRCNFHNLRNLLDSLVPKFLRLKEMTHISRFPLSVDAADAAGETLVLRMAQVRGHNGDECELTALWSICFLHSMGASLKTCDKDGCDMIWYLCHNHNLFDKHCLELITKRLSGLSKEDQRMVVNASMNCRKKATALMEACISHHGAVVKHFLDIGADVNVVSEKGSTALDVALAAALDTRQRALNSWLVNNQVIAKDGRVVPRDGTRESLFERTFTESDLGSDVTTGVDRNRMEQYFASTEIIADLMASGAQRARDLVEDYEEHDGPRAWDANLIEEWGSDLVAFKPEMQPYWERWKILYDLLDG